MWFAGDHPIPIHRIKSSRGGIIEGSRGATGQDLPTMIHHGNLKILGKFSCGKVIKNRQIISYLRAFGCPLVGKSPSYSSMIFTAIFGYKTHLARGFPSHVGLPEGKSLLFWWIMFPGWCLDMYRFYVSPDFPGFQLFYRYFFLSTQLGWLGYILLFYTPIIRLE